MSVDYLNQAQRCLWTCGLTRLWRTRVSSACSFGPRCPSPVGTWIARVASCRVPKLLFDEIYLDRIHVSRVVSVAHLRPVHKFNESKRMAKRLTEEWGRSRKPQHPLLHGRWGPVGTHADQLSAQRDERVRRPPGDTHADHPSSRGSERKAESDFRPPSRSSSKSFLGCK